MDSARSHPYYPVDARIIDYVPNETSVLGLLSSASVGATALLGGTLLLSNRARPKLKKVDRAAILWFVLCMSLTSVP